MKRMFVILAGMLFGVCSTYCSQRSMSRTEIRPFEDYYRGNPNTDRATLYVYLCRKGLDPLEEKCRCTACGGDITGLSLGFICVDEENEEFVGIGPNTSNILWSMYVAFSGEESGKGCSCRLTSPGKLKASYCYNPIIYAQVERLTRAEDVYRNADFLHNEKGEPLENRLERGVYDKGSDELSVTRILRRALFRVKFPNMGIPTVSEALVALGGIGERRRFQVMDGLTRDCQVLVPYSIGGVMGHNCATFCRQALSVLAPFPTIKLQVRPVITAAAFAAAAAEGGAIGASGGPIGAAVGAVVGVAAEGALIGLTALVKMVKANTPESVINMALDYFQEQYEKGDDATRRDIDSFFSVVAQDRTDISRYVVPDGSVFQEKNEWSGLEYKKIADVIAAKTRIKWKVFFKEDFEERSDGSSCSIM